jgi:hypothetical protein
MEKIYFRKPNPCSVHMFFAMKSPSPRIIVAYMNDEEDEGDKDEDDEDMCNEDEGNDEDEGDEDEDDEDESDEDQAGPLDYIIAARRYKLT